MKKIYLFILSLIIFTGCTSTLLNTPTKKVEKFFNKYQSLDDDVITELKSVVSNEISFTKEQGLRYIELMKRHYQTLKYRIKDEVIDGDTAIVTVEIEVNDYSNILSDADKYLENNKVEFMEDDKFSQTSFNEYRLDRLEKSNERAKYTVDITLSKIDDEWVIDDLEDEVKDKIEGVYTKA